MKNLILSGRYFNFLSSLFNFAVKSRDRSDLKLSFRDLYPRLDESTKETTFDRHYIYHTAWAARKLKELKPAFHIDISSSLYFSTIVSAFIPIRFYDYRPVKISLSGLTTRYADLTRLHFKSNSIKSLSCMHTVEHIGLGRYGDPIDPLGDIKAINQLKRVLKKGGSLLFVTPVGRPKIVFNAHRIYSKDQIVEYFKGLKLIEFVLIPDNIKDGNLIINPEKNLLNKQNYGCGCFLFRK